MRPNRIKSARDGAHYHTTARTVHRLFLFDDEIKDWIYDRILWLASIYHVTLHAVAVLDNHYHIVHSVSKPERDDLELQRLWERAEERKARPKTWQPWEAARWHERLSDLSEFAKELNQSVAVYVNLKTGYRGHLWDDRFHSVLVDDGRGLLATMAYVELNCVRAAICATPSEYRWCSMGRNHNTSLEAGVTVPPLPGLNVLTEPGRRQKAFYYFVEDQANQEAGNPSTFPVDIDELEQLVDDMEWQPIHELLFQRSRMLTRSLVLGGADFCRQAIKKFNLHRTHGKGPFHLQESLFNTRERAGPGFPSI